jgi:hypothetical protein
MGTYEGYNVAVELQNELVRFSKRVDEIVKKLKEEGI